MKGLFLIYIHKIGGTDYKGNYIYDFIFSDTTKDIDGEYWDAHPASGRPEPPHENFIKKVGRLENEMNFDVVQNSDTFDVWDALDGVIALAWENINDYETYPKNRLHFKFGMTIEEVEAELYERDLILNYKLKSHEQKN